MKQSMLDAFGKHTSQKLQEVFSQRPFQIQEPEKAKIIFLGLDANFDKNLETDKELFQEFLDYLEDGVGYWNKHGFHTPMLSKLYKSRAGKSYHQKFEMLGLTSKDAQDICFLELLNVCTFGKMSDDDNEYKKLLNAESNKSHLNRISRLVKDQSKQIYICGTKVVECIEKFQLFDITAPNVFVGKHFSDWSRCSPEYLKHVGKSIRIFLDTGKYLSETVNETNKKVIPTVYSNHLVIKKEYETVYVIRDKSSTEGYYQFYTVEGHKALLAKIDGNKRKAPDMYAKIQLIIIKRSDDDKITEWTWK